MSRVIIPFNHQPVSIDSGDTTYTCPAGKYARVTCSVSVSAACFSTTTDASLAAAANSVATPFFWLRAGDVLAFSNNSATGGSPFTTVGISINSDTVAQFRVRVPDTGTITASVFNWFYAEEFNVVT